MKGPIGVLFEEDERADLVSLIVDSIKGVPFVPDSILSAAVNMAIDWYAKHFEEALFASYREHMMCITLDKLKAHLESEHETLEHGFERCGSSLLHTIKY
eukprot:SAG31_NODE_3131_length_4641_cov_1.488771_4_plen_100_part_00